MWLTKSSETMKIRRQNTILKYGKKMSAQNSIFSENVLPKNSSVQAFTFDFVSSTVLIKNMRAFLATMKISPDFPDWTRVLYNIYMCVCVYVCMYMYIYVYVYMYVYICMCVYIYIFKIFRLDLTKTHLTLSLIASSSVMCS